MSEGDKERLLTDILAELVGHLEAQGLRCRVDPPRYDITDVRRRGWRARRKNWRLIVRTTTVAPAETELSDAETDVFLSLRSIPRELRTVLSARRVMWIDIENKERSDLGNDLGEEVVHNLRRYGVRFYRVDDTEASR